MSQPIIVPCDYSDSDPSVPPVSSSYHHDRNEESTSPIHHLYGQKINVVQQGTLTICEKIGRGSFGVVYRAVKKDKSGLKREFAVKAIDRTRAAKYVARELANHERTNRHVDVVTVHQTVIASTFALIVMDFHRGGTLMDCIYQRRLFVDNNVLVKSVFLQLIDAVQYCHSKGVFHRDLKPDNILCSEDGSQIFLSDFGLSVNDEESNSIGAGTRSYQSPECLGAVTNAQGTYNTRQADVYSLGVILFMLITGCVPWTEPRKSDPCYRAHLFDNRFMFTVYPISYEAFLIFLRIFAPAEQRITLPELRNIVESVDEFFVSPENLAKRSARVQITAKWYKGECSSSFVDSSEVVNVQIRNHESVCSCCLHADTFHATRSEPQARGRFALLSSHSHIPGSASTEQESQAPVTPEVGPTPVDPEVAAAVATGRTKGFQSDIVSIPAMWLDGLTPQLSQYVNLDPENEFSEVML